MKRVVIYAAVYGSVGVLIGVLMALYTKDTPPMMQALINPNHRMPDGTVATQPQPQSTEVTK